MNDVIIKKAYAKINLGLKTLYKREDNYHELEMIMINVDLYDVLRFEKSDDLIVCTDVFVYNICFHIAYKYISAYN